MTKHKRNSRRKQTAVISLAKRPCSIRYLTMRRWPSAAAWCRPVWPQRFDDSRSTPLRWTSSSWSHNVHIQVNVITVHRLGKPLYLVITERHTRWARKWHFYSFTQNKLSKSDGDDENKGIKMWDWKLQYQMWQKCTVENGTVENAGPKTHRWKMRD